MSLVATRDLMGIGSVPSSKPAAIAWLKRSGTKFVYSGQSLLWVKSALPEEVRRAILSREIEATGLLQGVYDDEAHSRLAEMPVKLRQEAERKADIARLLLSAGKSLTWSEKLALAKARYGAKGVSLPSLNRILKAVEGVDPVNFAPALLADYNLSGAPCAPISQAAWSYFLTTLRDAGEGFPLKQAWRDVRDVSPAKRWDWPSWPTLLRRWQSLPLAQKLNARLGHSEAVKQLAQPAMRDKTTILPLEWVSLDGRTKDFWAHNGDGKARRYTFLALVDWLIFSRAAKGPMSII